MPPGHTTPVPIRLLNKDEKAVSQAYTPNKMDHAKWKSINKNCVLKMVSKVMYILVRGHLGLCKDVLKYIITVILFQFGSGRSAKLVVASACGFVAAFTYFLDFFCLVQARRIVRTREREYHDYAREQQNKQLRGNQLDITKESVIF